MASTKVKQKTNGGKPPTFVELLEAASALIEAARGQTTDRDELWALEMAIDILGDAQLLREDDSPVRRADVRARHQPAAAIIQGPFQPLFMTDRMLSVCKTVASVRQALGSYLPQDVTDDAIAVVLGLYQKRAPRGRHSTELACSTEDERLSAVAKLIGLKGSEFKRLCKKQRAQFEARIIALEKS